MAALELDFESEDELPAVSLLGAGASLLDDSFVELDDSEPPLLEELALAAEALLASLRLSVR